MMRVVDVFLSVPFLFVVLILAVRFGATVLSLSLVIGFFPGRSRPGWSAARCSRCGNATTSWLRGRPVPAAGG